MRPRWRHAVLVTIRRSWGRAGAQAAREGHVIELDEDLVIEERDDDRRYNFDRAVGLAIDETDRLYIHDSKRFRVVVYNADGRFSRAYGGAGDMAPFHLGWIAVAGERLAISTGACRTGEGGLRQAKPAARRRVRQPLRLSVRRRRVGPRPGSGGRLLACWRASLRRAHRRSELDARQGQCRVRHRGRRGGGASAHRPVLATGSLYAPSGRFTALGSRALVTVANSSHSRGRGAMDAQFDGMGSSYVAQQTGTCSRERSVFLG